MPKINHLGLKLASLLCGITLWFYVVSGREYRIDVELPLRYVNLPHNLAISSRPPVTLPARLSGTALDLIRMKASDSASWLEIDLRDATLGQQTASIGDAGFRAPGFPAVRFQGANGIAAIDLDIDTRIERRIPVKLRVRTEAANGYAVIGEPQMHPSEIVVSGARNTLTRIFEIPTRTEEFTDLRWDNSLPIGLDLSALPPFVTVGDTSVRVLLKVETLERRVFTGITVQLIGNYDRNVFSLYPPTATVEITGGRNVLAQTRQSDIQLYIEHTRFAIEDADSLAPTVRIARPIQSWQVRPEKFKLLVRPVAHPASSDSTRTTEGTL